MGTLGRSCYSRVVGIPSHSTQCDYGRHPGPGRRGTIPWVNEAPPRFVLSHAHRALAALVRRGGGRLKPCANRTELLLIELYLQRGRAFIAWLSTAVA